MFILNSIFYISLQTWIPVRSSIYLLPFILLFQACGLKALIEKMVNRLSLQNYDLYVYLALTGVLICYFALISVGKYRNFEPESGNPFELARSYLKEKTGPNDLIISSLYDTKVGFYFGDIIRKKNFNIYANGKIENIYYLGPNTGESKIEMDLVYPFSKRLEFLSLDKFEPMVSYKNSGVRPSAINIFRRRVELEPIINLNTTNLSIPSFVGNFGAACKVQNKVNGIRIRCDSSSFSCVENVLNIPNIEKNDLQLVFFHHVNDKGTNTLSYATVKSMPAEAFIKNTNTGKQEFNPTPDVYMANLLVNNIADLDVYGENIDLIDVTLQKMGGGKNVLICMAGKLFKDNSLIQGVKVFNWNN
jgi:hypothetical protein